MTTTMTTTTTTDHGQKRTRAFGASELKQGRIQEFLLGGRGFFFKGMGAQGAKHPEAPEF